MSAHPILAAAAARATSWPPSRRWQPDRTPRRGNGDRCCAISTSIIRTRGRSVSTRSTLEMLEVQLANTTAPFLLVSKLRPSMAASAARRTYVVNVSAMRAVRRRLQGAGASPHEHGEGRGEHAHPRTPRCFETDRILMTSVDTGWINPDERPHPTKGPPGRGRLPRTARPGGPRRVGHVPIVRGEAERTSSASSSRTARPAHGGPAATGQSRGRPVRLPHGAGDRCAWRTARTAARHARRARDRADRRRRHHRRQTGAAGALGCWPCRPQRRS